MNKLLLSVAFCAITSTAYAGGHKTSILHCGCTETGAGMVYKEISVSKRSKGHVKNHLVGEFDSCFAGYAEDGSEIHNEFLRTGSDCTLEGEMELEGLPACDSNPEDEIPGSVEGDSCAAIPMPPMP